MMQYVGRQLSARQMRRKNGPMLIRITKMRMNKMPLSMSKRDKLNFTCRKDTGFMFLYKCKVALTTH